MIFFSSKCCSLLLQEELFGKELIMEMDQFKQIQCCVRTVRTVRTVLPAGLYFCLTCDNQVIWRGQIGQD